ncbi:MAG: dTDP-4-dehydrorhamnose 3,5-epimerase [Candidatus Endonucleobacter bathymodioli]|uniref:dTDP-4-dehydrorhamnose 3,5-epimerase n=1 Tax=Candidatus Endonucleibacter bathymodioli TaxID=539814 RepID=A0AA90NX34_9GAMM|nr:dTDP-4-dehydrorhamnose 3,5-epimerase [Candidatus Endonucleobacter bathymodioli]
MKIIKTDIPDVLIFEPAVFGDERGFFMETFRESFFEGLGLGVRFVQDNHSSSVKGVLRGLHYQLKCPQGKLVRVANGSVYDVVVDVRKRSSYFGMYVGAILSEDNRRIMWVPPGFAHGFLVISDQAEFIYKCTDYYAPEFERSLAWDDPEVNIAWPLEQVGSPSLSSKDEQGILLADLEVFE